MKSLILVGLAVLLSGCLVSPVEREGGPGSVTVANTNPGAIERAAVFAFQKAGYSRGPSGFPQWISFDRRSGAFGELMFGSYGRETTFRVRVDMLPIPGTNDFRLVPRVSRVSQAGVVGFERDTKMLGFWAGQFRPIMREIQQEAANAGGGGFRR